MEIWKSPEDFGVCTADLEKGFITLAMIYYASLRWYGNTRRYSLHLSEQRIAKGEWAQVQLTVVGRFYG